MKRILPLLLAATLTSSACFGTFKLTKAVYGWNQGVGGKWLQEVVFLAFIILPVYGLATLGDALIFNTIEFWTGSNPIGSTEEPGETRVVTLPDGRSFTLTRVGDGVAIDHEGVTRVLAREGNDLVLRAADGALLARVTPADNGGAVVTDGEGHVVARPTAAELVEREWALALLAE